MSQDELIQIGAGHVSDVVQEIVSVIGSKQTLHLVKHFGGTSIAIPTGKIKHDEELEDVIGIEAAQTMYHHFGGTVLYIPKCLDAAHSMRNIEICLEYEEYLKTMAGTKAVMRLARRYSLSDRRVWYILKGTDPAAVTAERKRRKMQESAKRAPAESVPLGTERSMK